MPKQVKTDSRYVEKLKLARVIYILRKELGLSNKELSERSSLTYSYILNLQGKASTYPSFSAIKSIANAFNIMPWQLLYLAESTMKKDELIHRYKAFVDNLFIFKSHE